MNWKQLITDLRGPGGMTLREIAEESGLSISAVFDLHKERSLTTDYAAGTKLVEMHRRLRIKLRRRGEKVARPEVARAS